MFPIEAFQETIQKLTNLLQQHEIRFHFTGGLISVVYGSPRMTQDIDIVVDPKQFQQSFVLILRDLQHSDFLYDENTMRDAVESGGMFSCWTKKNL